ncbi:MAG: hypothetical protein K2W95_21615 [Candidatus Obscuribacterales bacterium]|nr:hypothetical protein [Candidatus Obscuribacterales bacterium]
MTVETQEQQELAVESAETSDEVKREIPRWAIVVGVLAFIVFNVLFLIFAMSVGTGEPG